jgi:hypothetical protein
MRLVKPLAAGLVLAAVFGVAARAADVVSLEWGKLTVEGDSSTRPKSWNAEARSGSMSLSMTFDTLTAKADGRINEASSDFSGYFTVQQPRSAVMSNLQIDLKGNIVKTAGATASLDVKIGGEHQLIEWKEDEEAAGPFVKTLKASIAGGQLPNPFTIAITANVKKQPDKGAAVISLEAIEVHAGPAKLASRGH